MHIFLGVVIGGLFWQMGNDATKTLFNFGFCFTVIIAFMYMLVAKRFRWFKQSFDIFVFFQSNDAGFAWMLVTFSSIYAQIYCLIMLILVPLQVQSLKREYFNRWYRCNPYFFAMSIAKLPMQMLNTFLYLTIVYLITDQPLELNRIGLFYLVSILTSLTSESFGLLISSRLNVMVRIWIVFYRKEISFCCFSCLSQNGVFIGPGRLSSFVFCFTKL